MPSEYTIIEEPFAAVEESAAPYGQVHNEEMNLAWRFITETSTSVFLTGKAGTGKTTFLRKLREVTPKRMVVLAPTGVAAINAQGQTIHSFFQLPLGPIVPGSEASDRNKRYQMSQEKKNIIRTLDLLVIDEISMVRCDVLDAIDTELRKYRDRYKPFGGVQLLLIGDLQQLSPVTKESEWHLLSSHYHTPYFFGSKALAQLRYVTIELQHIYRQQDLDFINILAAIRENRIDASTLQALNTRYVPSFTAPEEEEWIRLTTHNRTAHDYNISRLEELPGEDVVLRATVHRNFPETNYPADEILRLREGAQVMFIKNDPSSAHEYYNGKIGVVHEFGEDVITVYCKEDDSMITVPRLTWENTKYTIDPETKDIREEVEGTFTQYPLRLAWAITVHKSQGLTFDHAVLDINASFAHGQVYVALSRCRTLEGLVLTRPLTPAAVINDYTVTQYLLGMRSATAESVQQLPQMRFHYYLELLNELFDFHPLLRSYDYLMRVVEEHLYKRQPEFAALLRSVRPSLEAEVVAIGARFQPQYHQLMLQSPQFAANEQLQERIHAAARYFSEKLHTYLDQVVEGSTFPIENKAVSTQYNNALDDFLSCLKLKYGVYTRLASAPFSVSSYLKAKAQSIFDELSSSPAPAPKPARTKAKKAKKEEPAKPKAKKGDSKLKSLALYQQGLTIAQIATERGMAVSTIEGHLASFVKTGEIRVSDFVTPAQAAAIHSAIASLSGSYTISDIRERLDKDEISYFMIRLVMEE